MKQDPKVHLSKYFVDAMMHRYKLDRGYPLNYLAWLFDPTEITQLDPADNSKTITKGLDVTIFGLSISASGVLSGAFGVSGTIANGASVTDAIGGRIGNTLLLT